MIRTAILAGLLLVMLSMAYSRSVLPGVNTESPRAQVQASPQPQPASVANVAPAAPAKHVQTAAATPSHRNLATVRENLLPERASTPSKSEPVPPAKVVHEEVLPAPMPAKAALEMAAVAAPLPVKHSSIWPDAPEAIAATEAAHAAEEPAPATVARTESKPVQLAPAAVAPIEDMPVREVATPRVMTPRDLLLPSEAPASREGRTTTAFQEAADLDEKSMPSREPTSSSPRKNVVAKTESAPQFMTPEERTRELYRLAREMEDTFISKLAH